MDKLLAKQVAAFWGQPTNDPHNMTIELVAALLAEPQAQAGMHAALQAQAAN